MKRKQTGLRTHNALGLDAICDSIGHYAVVVGQSAEAQQTIMAYLGQEVR